MGNPGQNPKAHKSQRARPFRSRQLSKRGDPQTAAENKAGAFILLAKARSKIHVRAARGRSFTTIHVSAARGRRFTKLHVTNTWQRTVPEIVGYLGTQLGYLGGRTKDGYQKAHKFIITKLSLPFNFK